MIHPEKEEAVFLQKIAEKCNKAIDTYTPFFTDFLDGRSKRLALEKVREYSDRLIAVCYGGFDEAERVRIGLFSKEVYGYGEDEKELYGMYNKIISSMLNGEACDIFDVEDFTQLLNIIIEPSLKPIYEALDKEFYDKYLKG